MTTTAARENLYESYALLQYRHKALQRDLDEFRNGSRYMKLQDDYRRVCNGYIKVINSLKQDLAKARAEGKKEGDLWYQECVSDWEKYQKELNKKDREIRHLSDKNWAIRRESDEKIASLTKLYEEKLDEKDAIIDALKAEVAHKDALLNRDSSNTSLPTGQTPLRKKKRIPNSRMHTGRKKGGQVGHEKHTLGKPEASEVTEEVNHRLEDASCPTCGAESFFFTGECEERYEYDVQITTVKRKHKFWLYECNACGERVWSGEDPRLHAECQYGAGVQALALHLRNTTNAAINKVPDLFAAITSGEIRPSEGYIAKLQHRAAKLLELFRRDLIGVLISRRIVFWDDTVIFANKERICLRFYGDEHIAVFFAHAKKDLVGMLEDNILQVLSPETRVMHDHNTVNYNALFHFINLECNAHVLRDLQKSYDDTGHVNLRAMKELISKAINDRNNLALKGVEYFDAEYIAKFDNGLAELLRKAEAEAKKNQSIYSGPFERALVARLIKYKENFFAWMHDFSLPVTNNLSERALRGVKTKLKVSGQFDSVKTASEYATIRTYLETCRRNGINEMSALMRLSSGNPYTAAEIFG